MLTDKEIRKAKKKVEKVLDRLEDYDKGNITYGNLNKRNCRSTRNYT